MDFIMVGSIVGIVAIIVILMVVAASRYKKAGPHEALIATGKGGQKIVIGGGMFVMPVLYKLYHLDLQARTVPVQRDGIYTKNRVPISVSATMTYKVKGTEEAVKLAAQAMQETNEKDISEMVQNIAEGAFRDICGKMTPEDINEDREKFQNQVTENVEAHFKKMGIDLIAFIVSHISDKEKYFESLGAPAIAKVTQEARQRRAEADKTATITEVEQKKDAETRRAETEANIFEAQKQRDVKKATYDGEVAIERAKAEQAGPKQTAVSTQEVVEKEITLKDKEAERKEKELLSTVVKPAEADKKAAIVKAEGDKQKKILEAEGERQKKILEAEGEKQSLSLKGEGEGTAAEKKGEGEAAGIKAKLFAEADGLERKAEAMKKFNESGMGLQVTMALIDKLPEIIKAAGSPVTAIDKMQVIDFGGNGTGGNGGGGPIARLLDVPPEVLAKTDTSMKTILGIGLTDFVQLIRKGGITGLGAAKEGDEVKTDPPAGETPKS